MLVLKSITAQRFDRSLRSESVRNKIKIFETEINVGISNAPIVPDFTAFLLVFELFEKTKDWGSRGREFNSSGGGSSSSSRRYDVSAPSVKHGDVTVSPKSASKGDTVTITVKPDSGYELDTLTVKDASGSKIKVKDKGNGKFTFTMPASKVTVSAEFAEIETMDFTDVSTDAYYYEAVKWAAKKGITGGTGDGTFNPNGACTRAQSVTFLYRALGTAPTTVNGFTDVTADAFYADAVAWAVESGVTNGTSASTFSPNNGCTRAQIVTFLYRTMK